MIYVAPPAESRHGPDLIRTLSAAPMKSGKRTTTVTGKVGRFEISHVRWKALGRELMFRSLLYRTCSVEARVRSKRPMLSDLRESVLEQDVIQSLLYREDYYN